MQPKHRLHNQTTGYTFPTPAYLLTSLWERYLGMSAPGLVPGAIVGLRPCHWIHTCGLRIPLDVAYCDGEGRVLRLTSALPPWRFDQPVARAKTTWEAPAGTFRGILHIGDTLELFSAADVREAYKEGGR